MNKYKLPQNHYSMPIEPIEFIQANNLSFAVGNVIKYVCRYEHKNGLEDLQKAKNYIDILMQDFGEKICKEENDKPEVDDTLKKYIDNNKILKDLLNMRAPQYVPTITYTPDGKIQVSDKINADTLKQSAPKECDCKEKKQKYYNPATKQYDLDEPVTIPQYGD